MTGANSTHAIWTRLSSDLRRFIRRRVADDHVADDLLQETFVRIHRSIESLQEPERLAAWVYRIARNVVYDHHRQPTNALVPLEALELADDPKDGGRRIGCADGEWLEAMIETLSPIYREAVRWSGIDGLSQQEVAQRLGLSLSGAKSRIQRGRAMLKDALELCCRFEFDRRGGIVDCDPRSGGAVCRGCREPGAF
jgi:RNA polymerase sigma-70 factor (ECF subfamily)